MMVALREGRTLRTFGVRAPRLEAYFLRRLPSPPGRLSLALTIR
jgi:hypothetical protein